MVPGLLRLLPQSIFANYASQPLAKPIGAPVTLRVASIQNLVPAGMLRMVGVAKVLGDDALEVGIDHGSGARLNCTVVGWLAYTFGFFETCPHRGVYAQSRLSKDKITASPGNTERDCLGKH